jgi:hypothetical protein
MKARIKFQKYGAMKFIGHLDVMRYFQKAFRRAGYDIEYTQGFNPHQVMSFASPLGLGLTSDAEYVDIGLKSCEDPEIMVGSINEALTEGFYVTGFHILPDDREHGKKESAMSLVSAADYLVSLKDGYEMELQDGIYGNGSMEGNFGERLYGSLEDYGILHDKFRRAFERFYSQPNIIINKKTKKNEMMVDIKPMICFTAFDETEYRKKLSGNLADFRRTESSGSYSVNAESKADVYENKIRVYMQLAAGSAVNLKPEQVMESFCAASGISYNPFAWQVHRLEIYTRDEETKKLIPLDRFL